MTKNVDVRMLLNALLDRSGMSIEELSAALGPDITLKSLECYLCGSVVPSAKNMRRLAEFFGFDVEQAMALRDREANERRAPYNGCDIPMRNHNTENDEGGDDPWTGTMFCANACPDAANIPDRCKGICEPAEGTLHNCRSARACPCAKPPARERERAFQTWLAERKRRITAAKRQDTAVADARATWEAMDRDDTPGSLW